MWNISDYLYHNRDKLVLALASDAAVCPEVPNHAELPPLDKLWMCLYIRLSELCTEARAPVRRAASQTLFSCIGAHGTLLSKPAWRALLAVLFPMLEEVQKQSNIASSEKVDTGEHILIHHTRNTAQKQWAETQVLTLSGVSRVFHSRFQLLTTVGDFNRSWTALLDYITDFALRRSHEVSVGALKSFQEVVSAAGRATDVDPALMKRVWGAAWAAWTNIASSSHSLPPPSEDGKPVEVYAPSQNFLTTLVQIFPLIFQHIRPTFTPADVTQLGLCLSHVCSTEPSAAASALDSLAAAAPVSLHALHCLDIVHKEALQRHELLAVLFGALTSLAAACSSRAGGAAPRCLAAAAALYRAAPAAASNVLPHLLLALHASVLQYGQDKRRKTAEQMEETAQISSLLLQVLSTGLPLARENPDEYKEFWETLPRVLETFLFEPPVGGGRAARQLVVALREQALRARPRLPPQHARALLALVRAGSLHTQPPQPIQNEQELKEREEFARTCFETLLQYSMLEDIDSFAGVENDTDPLAIVALLDRFEEVISKYTQDEDNTEPLPRHQLSEISFVLKAVATLTESMKKAPPGKVDAVAWHKLIGVYPSLARLAASARAAGAGGALRDALLPFGALLAPPL
ncbi:unnamed protein product [Chrysodeixis includens]|uniref:Mon2 C-terminal domain-containing protein n=1 Tax=Chrysodeixis includens TaxID=689277 RepID=A0A9P0BR50_CHRIL|nr:unnamed protein product [Chrysodeixis includens]